MSDSTPNDAVWRNPSFLLLWIAQAISQTIQNLTFFTLLVFVDERTKSTAHVGLLILSTILPAVLFGVAAGVFIDRWNKRFVLIGTNLLRAAAVLGYLVLDPAAENAVLLFYSLNFVFSTISQFFLPAEASMIPRLVGKERLIAANGLFNITFTLSQVFGFIVLGPPLVKLFDTQAVFIGVSICYVICAALVFGLPNDRGVASTEEQGMLSGVTEELVAGWRLLRGDIAISLAMLHLTVVATLTLTLAMLAPGFLSRELLLNATDTYLIFGPAGAGILFGTFVLQRLTSRFRKLSIINFGLGIFGVGMLIIAGFPILERLMRGAPLTAGSRELTTTLAVVAATAFFMGIAVAFVNVTAQTILQERAPIDMRGKVFAVQLMFGSVASILPLVFFGQLADRFGVLPVSAIVGAVVMAITYFSILKTRAVREQERLDDASAAGTMPAG